MCMCVCARKNASRKRVTFERFCLDLSLGLGHVRVLGDVLRTAFFHANLLAEILCGKVFDVVVQDFDKVIDVLSFQPRAPAIGDGEHDLMRVPALFPQLKEAAVRVRIELWGRHAAATADCRSQVLDAVLQVVAMRQNPRILGPIEIDAIVVMEKIFYVVVGVIK